MTSSLVGSEMCIRDSLIGETLVHVPGQHEVVAVIVHEAVELVDLQLLHAVSYTHLTLPTICSV
eukprot:1278954-Prorocentrum_lima.AAC.1